MSLEQLVMTTQYNPQVKLPEMPDYTAMTDEQLITRISRQDLVASSVYYARHGATIYGRLLALLRDEGSAQRALEEFFLELWRHRRDLAKLGPAVTDTLLAQSTLPALRSLSDEAKSRDAVAQPAGDDHDALIARCRELDEPDLADGVVRTCIESILADAVPVVPPADVRRRLSVRLGHPDVDRAVGRYAQRWRSQAILILSAAFGLMVILAWLVWQHT